MAISPPFDAFEHLKQNDFELCIRRLAEIRDEKEMLEREEKDLRMQVGAALDTVGIRSVLCGPWTVSLIENPGRSSLDRQKLQIGLVERGVGADIVTAAVEEATKKGKPFTTVSIRERKMREER